MIDRRKMLAGDWLNSAALVAVGVFLGLAVDGMMDLAGTAFWPLIIIIPTLFGAVLVFGQLIDRLIDRILPSGIKPAMGQRQKERTPLVLVLSLPSGMVIGLIGAQFGLKALLL